MSNRSKAKLSTGEKNHTRNDQPRCLVISERGIRTSADFANLMSAMMSDLIAGRMTAQVGNATCNAGSKLLKIIEMQHQYGTNAKEPTSKIISLADMPLAVG